MDSTPRANASALPSPASATSRRYERVRQDTVDLARPLSAEDCTVQSMPDASPVKWHLAHTTWFFETFVLNGRVAGYRPFDDAFCYLFNSYYDAVGDRHPRPERGMLTRPGLEQVLAYRDHVDDHMRELLAAPLDDTVSGLVELGLNHEQQHQELILTDVKHMLSRNPLAPVYRKPWPLATILPKDRHWLRFEAGLHSIGHDGDDFAYDNESPRHRVWLEAFEVASHPVTHGDFIGFIEDGGYQRPDLWLAAGWDAVQRENWKAPLYWRRADGGWRSFTLHGEVPVDPFTPVCHLSFYEAEAFARWAGARLPTEAEWEVAVRDTPVVGNFMNSGALHPLAPQAAPAPGALCQAFGDVWEWTRSDYAPYPGFKTPSGAVGEYNGKFMSGQIVLRGGSCATPPGHLRATYRNFFPPQARWQFSGVRLARDCD